MKDLADAWYSEIDFKVLWVQTLKQVQGDAKQVQGDVKQVKVTELGFRISLKQVQGDVYSV